MSSRRYVFPLPPLVRGAPAAGPSFAGLSPEGIPSMVTDPCEGQRTQLERVGPYIRVLYRNFCRGGGIRFTLYLSHSFPHTYNIVLNGKILGGGGVRGGTSRGSPPPARSLTVSHGESRSSAHGICHVLHVQHLASSFATTRRTGKSTCMCTAGDETTYYIVLRLLWRL